MGHLSLAWISKAWVALAVLGAVPPAFAQEDVPKPEEVRLDDDVHRRYLLHGPAADTSAPPKGWRLLVVLPGGSGNAEFAPFVGRIRQHALGDDWLVAQIVAPVWDEKQAKVNVWPTKLNPWPGMEFSCEALFADVVEDLAEKRKLDPRFLLTLSWSSSGSLAYTLALDKDSGVTGSFVAMSVYKPDLLPPLKAADGQRFYLLHSPEDEICPMRLAEQARDELDRAGALVEFATYAGGHGWHGDVFGTIRTGVQWLEDKAEKAKLRKRSR